MKTAKLIRKITELYCFPAFTLLVNKKSGKAVLEDFYVLSLSLLEGRRLVPAKGREGNLKSAMGQVFSPKQGDLFLKKLKESPMSKTEREYFSRTVRKKAAALANEELHRLAKRVVEDAKGRGQKI